jgi:hypothetical protein
LFRVLEESCGLYLGVALFLDWGLRSCMTDIERIIN